MAPEKFRIIDVPSDAPEKTEVMGTKPKFWFSHKQLGRCLFKKARPGTGEDWAEKVAAELATILHLPCAQYEMAKHLGDPGTVSPSFVPAGQSLYHGNDLLFMLDMDYHGSRGAARDFYRVSKHTLDAVLGVLDGVSAFPSSTLPEDIRTGSDVFVGYLLLDALIGNTDRHHQNWGVFADHSQPTGPDGLSLQIAPTYDHASSMGRELTDIERDERLHTRDRNRTVAAYADRARSALYNRKGDARPLSTMQAFRDARIRHPHAARAWIGELQRVCDGDFRSIMERIPSDRLSAVASDFALTLVSTNRERLLDTQG